MEAFLWVFCVGEERWRVGRREENNSSVRFFLLVFLMTPFYSFVWFYRGRDEIIGKRVC